MRRRAIIIKNDRVGGDFINGVNHDAENFKQFLMKPYGGAWTESDRYDDNEIEVIYNQINKRQLLYHISMLKECGTKYFLIYFVGHGYATAQGEPMMIMASGYELSVSELRNACSGVPAMLITDSCQAYEEDSRLLNEARLRMFSQGGVIDSAVYETAKLYYNFKLSRLPKDMFTIASAVSLGQEAGEDSNKGGYYSVALLDACKKCLKDETLPSNVYGIGGIHYLAQKDVEARTNGKQVPSLSGYTRSSQPPFLVKL